MYLPDIILVDDHRLFRSGLKYLLEASGKFKVIGEASNGRELMELLENRKPRLIILDINMPELNGIEITKIALAKYPQLKILIISMVGEKEYYQSLLDCGIKGVIPKDADNEEFFLAIEKILSGETYFAQQLLLDIIRENIPSQQVKFSRREKEILNHISQGLSNREIAAKLNLSQRTVERHRTHLLEKTDSRNSIRLVIYALKHNLITI